MQISLTSAEAKVVVGRPSEAQPKLAPIHSVCRVEQLTAVRKVSKTAWPACRFRIVHNTKAVCCSDHILYIEGSHAEAVYDSVSLLPFLPGPEASLESWPPAQAGSVHGVKACTAVCTRGLEAWARR